MGNALYYLFSVQRRQFLRRKATNAQTWPLISILVEVRNAWNYPFTPRMSSGCDVYMSPCVVLCVCRPMKYCTLLYRK